MNVISPYTKAYQSPTDAIDAAIKTTDINRPIRIIQEASVKGMKINAYFSNTVWVDGSYKTMLQAQEYIDDFFIVRDKLAPEVVEKFNKKERWFKVIYLNRIEIVAAYKIIYDIAANVSEDIRRVKTLKLDMLDGWTEYWDF